MGKSDSGDDSTARATRSSTGKSDIKKQVFDLITNDKELLDNITAAVACVIADKISNDENLISILTTKLSSSTELKEAISTKLSDPVKQDLHASLSFDNNLQTKKIASLENEVCALKQAHEKFVEDTEIYLDGLEQYGRRNCLLVHGIAESPSEDTDKLVTEMFKDKLDLEIDVSALDRSHRLRKRGNATSTKPKPIIVKFMSYNIRSWVFRAKRKLKNTGISITESLTKYRQDLYSSIQSHPAVKAAWTLDGRIICLMDNDRKILIENRKQAMIKLPGLSASSSNSG